MFSNFFIELILLTHLKRRLTILNEYYLKLKSWGACMKSKFDFIQKREGRLVPFDKEKIINAVFAAARAAGGSDRKLAEKLADQVVSHLNRNIKQKYPTVEQIQDSVERILIEEGHARTAKAYISYRQKRTEVRSEKAQVLQKERIDEVDKCFDLNALKVLTSRYLRKDESGKLVECPKELFTRVAVHTALPDLLYDTVVFSKVPNQRKNGHEKFIPAKYEGKIFIGKYELNKHHLEGLKRTYDRMASKGHMKISWKKFFDMLSKRKFEKYEKTIDAFYNLMVSKKFLPNTPALANFGNPLGMGSACFVLDIDDSMEEIMETLKKTALVFKAGGGMGYNFSKLRPEGDFVSSTHGLASGPLSFMRLFDTMTEVIKQGGIRRGANMGILNSNHPDIENFVKAKEGNKALKNFNISVMLMDDFWECYRKNKPYPLLNPRSGKVMRTIDAKNLFDIIVHQAWESAEPGVIYFDNVNKYNPLLEGLGPIYSTNPCVSADTLIPTAKGLERIDSIKASSIVVDSRILNQNKDNVTLQLGTMAAEHLQAIKTGIKETYKITTNSGYELIATPDHRIMTTNGWKPLIELSTEDELLIQSGEGLFNSNAALPFVVENKHIGKNGREYSFNLPTQWDYHLGLVLGWLTGDGWFNKKYNQAGFVFSKEDKLAMDIIKPILEKYFNGVTVMNQANGCIQLRSNSRYVSDYLNQLGLKSFPEEKEVPSALFTATKEAILGFLSGLFSSDGTVALGSKSRNYIRLNSSSVKLLKQVQLLLLNLGIRTSIYDRSTKSKCFKYTSSKGEEKIYKTSGINYELNISKENLARFIGLIGLINSNKSQKMDKLKEFEFYKETFTDAIESIEYAGMREVWDITEPLTHSFIANGILVHNCGEVLLYPNESCNLGSINIWAFCKEDKNAKLHFDWDGLKETIILASHFLDNVIDINKFPLKEIEEMSLNTRKIGLGVMGVADAMFEMDIPYDNPKGRAFMEQLMEFINYYSKVQSIDNGKKKGKFPFYHKSFYSKGKLPFKGIEEKKSWHFDWNKLAKDIKKHGLRNSFTTVIAPTGSISMIAGCSSGIEPMYSLVFEKNVKVGSFYYVNRVLEKRLSEEGLFDDLLVEDVVKCNGSVQTIGYIPPRIKNVFVTSHDIVAEDHIRALASFQKWTDSSISKTINFPADVSLEEMEKSYVLAHDLGCKDVTVYRDSSLKEQVLITKKRERKGSSYELTAESAKPDSEYIVVGPANVPENSAAANNDNGHHSSNMNVKKCPNDGTVLIKKEGCTVCPVCGYGLCSND